VATDRILIKCGPRPAAFTHAQIDALATLARLELSASEADTLSRQLGAILEYARQVQQIDTEGVPPTASVATGHEVDREDRVRPSLDRADALANAPDPANEAGLFRVPRVI
jgi:aspartyl-tRNA(Asn)/glutamyl-tRNA(Gln) amidotransferase subunit C